MELLLVVATHLLLLLFSSTTYAATITNSGNNLIPCATITANTPTDQQNRGDMLAVFNDFRASIAQGNETSLKKAKNMYKLSWDCDMEKKVQEAVDKLDGKITLTKKYAQNYAVLGKLTNGAGGVGVGGANTPPTIVDYAKAAKDEWYKQVKMYGLDNSQTYTSGLDFFANMANAKATQIACAYKENATANPAEEHFSCIFNVKPVLGQSIYERGNPCTKNAQCTTYPGSGCDKYDTKLCEYKGDVPASGATTATDGGASAIASGATTATDGGASAIASGSNYMTEAGRAKVVDAHNYRRTLLATGQIRNGKNPSNANLPTAALMYKMEYSESLEAQAIDYAKDCSLKKSAESTRTGFGENVYVHATVIKDPVELLKTAVISWWTQIFQDGINLQVIFKASLRDKEASKGIDQTAFTQMAWAKTSKIGCAIVDCSGKSFVVCRYSPAGNILDQAIYPIGSVCQGCPGTCSPVDGLCVVK